jgi:hypothetical protein
MDGSFVKSGILQSASGKTYPITKYVPRFVTDDGYAENFTVEWEKHPDILHDSTSNFSAYRKRFMEDRSSLRRAVGPEP